MSYQPQTEAATSRFLNVNEGGRTLRIHINDCGDGKETVVMLHGSGPGATGWANFSRNIDPLVEAGYPSIGCEPCTKPVAAGEDPRSGRWAGLSKIECGLHL